MKTFIAASIFALSSSAAMAEAFAFERQFGTPELYPTLIGEQGAPSNSSRGESTSFAYERAIGTPALFPSLNAEGYVPEVTIKDAVADNGRVHDTIWGWNFPVGG